MGVLMNDDTTGGPVTEGAIVQHLAKTRTRMVEEGLPVPPPLKRGGRSRISTTSGPVSQGNQSSRAKKPDEAVPTVESAPVTNAHGLANVSKARVKGKRARKSTSEEDSDSDAWEPRRRPQRSNKKAKKDMGHEGDKSPYDEESEDKTVSDASEGFVGSHASFLPAEDLASTPIPSGRQGSLTITLDWGKAYPDNAVSYAMAAAKLVASRVIPQDDLQVSVDAGKEGAKGGTHEEDAEGDTHEEDDSEEDPEEVIAKKDDTQQNHNPGQFDEVPANAAEVSRGFNIASAAGTLPMNHSFLMNDIHTDSNVRSFRRGLGPQANGGYSYSNAHVIDTSAHLGDFTDAHQSDATTQHGYLHQGHFSAAGFARHAPGPAFHPNHAPAMYVRPDDLFLNGSAVLDRDFPDNASHTYGKIQRRFQDHSIPQLSPVDTITTQSSSTNGSFPAHFPDNTQTAYQLETGLENIGNHLGANELMLGYDVSHFDAAFPQAEYNVDDMNGFDYVR